MKAISSALIACAVGLGARASSAEAQTETVLYSFCNSGVSGGCTDGAFPYAGLTDLNGVLYGTTYWGGTGIRDCDGALSLACGTVFSFDPQTGAETVVYSLCSLKSRRDRICIDGKEPESGVIDVNGTLYGTSEWGGRYGYGTVFALDPANGAETVLYSFSDKHRDYEYGAFPNADLIDVNGLLYGTTPFGGRRGGAGTAFSLDPATGIGTVLHTFSAKHGDGRGPQAGMIDANGMLYGTTEYGGKHGYGTVFSLDPTTAGEAVVYSFKGYPSDGAGPVAGLLDINGMLYGTTESGGRHFAGMVFSLNPTTGAETVLYSFKGYPSDGAEPVAGLVSVDGLLYGTTEDGGRGKCYTEGGDYVGCGTVFSVDPQTGAETVQYSFSEKNNDGRFPEAGLIDVSGTLYGTTEEGGAHGYGTVFSILP